MYSISVTERRIASGTNHRRGRKRRSPRTRLALFMEMHDVTNVALSEASGVSRTYLAALRRGASDPTLGMMKWIAGGMSDIVGSRVHIGELFDLDFEVFNEDCLSSADE